MLKILALLSALGIPSAAIWIGPQLPSPLILPSIAIVLASPIIFWAFRHGKNPLTIMLALSLVGAGSFWAEEAGRLWPAAHSDSEVWQEIELSEAQDQKLKEGWFRVHGYLRQESFLDEYQVEGGARPDQNVEAEVVLLPLLNSPADTVTGPILIARMKKKDVEGRGAGKQILEGKLGPVSPDLVYTLLQVDSDQIPAYLLDTVDRPHRNQVITLIIMAGGAALLGLFLLLGLLRKKRSTGSH